MCNYMYVYVQGYLCKYTLNALLENSGCMEYLCESEWITAFGKCWKVQQVLNNITKRTKSLRNRLLSSTNIPLTIILILAYPKLVFVNTIKRPKNIYTSQPKQFTHMEISHIPSSTVIQLKLPCFVQYIPVCVRL